MVSGRGNLETWDETTAARLNSMFRTFRKEFAQQLADRFKLKGTPNEHVLLCLKMNPFIDTSPEGAFGGRATQELLEAVYKRQLRQALEHLQTISTKAASTSSAPGFYSTTPDPAASTTPAPAAAAALPPVGGSSSSDSPVFSEQPKKRQRIGFLATAIHMTSKAPAVDTSSMDVALQREIDDYAHARATVNMLPFQVVNQAKEVLDYDVDKFWYGLPY